MKKIYLSVSFLIFLNYFCIAQPPGSRIEVVKVAYITRQLNLTQEEAEKFWPVYNSYFAEIKQARLQNRNDEVAYEEKVVEVRKKYKENFRKILNSDERVNQLYTSERNFQDLLRSEQQRRQGNRRFGPQGNP